MGLTGLDIFKQLPKTNCGDCGVPTCLAFAMKLAQKQATLDQCPHVSEASKEALSGAAAPPIKLVTIGTGERKLEIGNETILFRHEETFYHPTGIAVLVDASTSEEELKARIKQVEEVAFERVGQALRLDAVAVKGEGEAFVKAVQAATASSLALILMNEDPTVMGEALKACAEKKPLIYAATAENVEAMAALAKEHACPLAVRADGLEALAELSEKALAAGATDLILDSGARKLTDVLANETMIRRAALRKRFRPFGFPTITFTAANDVLEETQQATTYIAKYAGIVVVENLEPWELLTLVTVRQNIYTDPQKPIQIEEGLYQIGTPDESSPVLVTTNFSLTYFTVEGDVEASRVPAWVVVVDTEGTSVLTAWAAEKFTAEIIAEKVKAFDVASKVKHRKIVLPGHVAVLSGKLEDELGQEWKVVVGPRESSGIPSFLRTSWEA
ncbi:MAG: acetyl-CoA decarbonylase/synthase complex subunit gamma [Armatimonadetes bacterium]|nr:acetyl-CoA decarbonylase/synthase complex subunit gamma [Armatimonadota bacterium]